MKRALYGRADRGKQLKSRLCMAEQTGAVEEQVLHGHADGGESCAVSGAYRACGMAHDRSGAVSGQEAA